MLAPVESARLTCELGASRASALPSAGTPSHGDSPGLIAPCLSSLSDSEESVKSRTRGFWVELLARRGLGTCIYVDAAYKIYSNVTERFCWSYLQHAPGRAAALSFAPGPMMHRMLQFVILHVWSCAAKLCRGNEARSHLDTLDEGSPASMQAQPSAAQACPTRQLRQAETSMSVDIYTSCNTAPGPSWQK